VRTTSTSTPSVHQGQQRRSLTASEGFHLVTLTAVLAVMLSFHLRLEVPAGLSLFTGIAWGLVICKQLEEGSSHHD